LTNKKESILLNYHKLFIILLILVELVSLEYFKYENYFYMLRFVLFNFVYILFFLFNFKTANYISILHKAFLLVLILPPFLHIVVEVFLEYIPLYAYPNDLLKSNIGKVINYKSYILTIVFINIYIVIIKFKKYDFIITKLQKKNNNSLFYIFTLMSLLFAYLSHFNNQNAFASGSYASGEANVLGVNAWNTMSVIVLLYGFNYKNSMNKIHTYLFYFTSFYVLAYSSLMFGKRADVIGLFLVFLSFYSVKVISLKKIIIILLLSSFVFILMSFTANVRGVGISDVVYTASFINEVAEYAGGFRIPSVTDFYGTMPYLISYLDYNNGIIWHGYSYYIAMTTLLPSVINPFRIDDSATTYLQANYYMFNGGMYFLAELLFNFGEKALFFIALLMSLFFSYVSKIFYYQDSFFKFAIILILIDGFPRWLLYGTSTMSKHVFIMFVLFYLGKGVYHFLMKKKKRKNIENIDY